ncbi:hypothetical protein H6501_02275 [Candidatus Woesearchaeota archaeon]|nr:hypothetical protein [Nanoarchaeota archaeon]MCB9370398.1 hypothetical protein [Candidatus Woesearchaeota archaeon]USN44916.1 MAG: hypothetical protein H6500_03715 [Candidatus Woesearchaeota archaeon]
MRENLKNILYLCFLIIFIAVLLLTILSFYYVDGSQKAPLYLTFFSKYHVFFMFFIAIIGVVFGSITQIMTSKRIESDKKFLQRLKKHFETSLGRDEREVIQYLLKNKGVCTQYELTKILNQNKLAISRLLVTMESKKLITKEKIGKINKVFLDKDLLEIFEKYD